MSTALLIARREFSSYFRSWLGPILVAAVLLADGILFYWKIGLDQKLLSAQVLIEFFYNSSGPTMIAAIILTIRLLAEERQTGTLTLLNNIDEVRDTILHEIAHALCPKDGHGPRWRATCRRLGAKPVRCYTDATVVSPPRAPAPYRFGCPKCDWWVDRRRRSRRGYLCKLCRGRVIFRMTR